MNQVLFTGINLNELLEKIGQLIEFKLQGSFQKSNPTLNQSTLISRKEVAKLLKISLPTLNEWTKSGLLKSYRIGTRILYKLSEVEESITQRDFKKFQRGGVNHA